LAAAGWRVTVLTVDRRVFTDITGADESLEAQVDPGIDVIRTPFDWPLRNPDRDTWSLPHRAFPRLWRKSRTAFELAVFPEIGYATWLRTLRRALADLHRRQSVDLVLATGNPHVSFVAAYGLARASAVPFVLDYRDAWLLNVFTGRQQFSKRSRAARWERRLIGAAAQTWFINQDILDWHADRYPAAADRFRLVPNGWDPGLLAPVADVVRFGEDNAEAGGPGRGDGIGRPLTFGYLGTMTASAPMAELIAGWRQAQREGLLPAGSKLRLAGYLGYFGGQPDPAKDPLAATVLGAAADGVEYVGRIDKTAVGTFYASLDGLVLPIKAGRYVTSGKVYEYVATGKPIVSVHPAEAGASRVLEGYPLWAPAGGLDSAAVAAAFGRGADLARSLTPAQTDAALAFGQRFRRDHQLGPAIAGLNDLLP
jgi:glycosyltransferase involved in cell wall biosynthesis